MSGGGGGGSSSHIASRHVNIGSSGGHNAKIDAVIGRSALHKMVKLVNGVRDGHIRWILPSRNRPEDAMHPEDVNILRLKYSSLLIKKGEVSIELPLRTFRAPLLSIRGMDDYTLKKSQALVSVAEVGLCCAFA